VVLGRPSRVRTAAWFGFSATERATGVDALLEAERDLVAQALPTRRSEFATGRWCAHAALAQVGVAGGVALLQDHRGAPCWPPGVTGSITHTTGWTGAVVARTGWRRGVRAVGIDAEVAAPLPAGALEVVASDAEQADLQRLAALDDGTPWDTVLHTAKEATYKAWYPLAGTVLPHDAVAVRLSADGRFAAVARSSAPGTARRALRVRGRWALGPAVVVSLAVAG